MTESRSLAGMLRPIASEYRVLLAATNGQCAGFLHTKLKGYLSAIGCVLYLGDYDLAGNDIEANSRQIIKELAGTPPHWERLAITEAQVAEYGLTPIVKKDFRFKPPREFEAVECEALSRKKLILDIVRNRLEELLPEPLSSVLAREEAQRNTLEAAIKAAIGDQ